MVVVCLSTFTGTLLTDCIWESAFYTLYYMCYISLEIWGRKTLMISVFCECESEVFMDSKDIYPKGLQMNMNIIMTPFSIY